MDVVEAIRTRSSIRDFKQDPVPKGVLKDILEVAGRAPSAVNTQPWEFVVIAGDVLENIRKANIEMLNSGIPPHPEHVIVEWPSDSVYRKRQVGLAMQIFQLMGIQREDKEKRAQWLERGFRYFNAPAAIIILIDRSLSGSGPLLDIGAVMQTICLAALKYNLGTCIEDQGVMYPEVLRRYADISESKRVIISIAIGYPNWDFPVNRLRSDRESVESTISWCGF